MKHISIYFYLGEGGYGIKQELVLHFPPITQIYLKKMGTKPVYIIMEDYMAGLFSLVLHSIYNYLFINCWLSINRQYFLLIF